METTDQLIITTTTMYKQESEDARRDRMDTNKRNFDCYNLKQDFSHKIEGQSREFLSKQHLAVEQITSFIQQGLMDVKDWFGVDVESGVQQQDLLISQGQVKDLLERELEKIDFMNTVGDSIKLGLIGSLMILKVGGEYVYKPKFVTKEEENSDGSKKHTLVKKDQKVWRLKLSLVRQQDYRPDPTGRGMYELQDIDMDWYDLKRMAKEGVYDQELVDQLMGDMEEDEQKAEKARETGQNESNAGYRRTVKVTEGWGNIIHPVSGELLYENVTWSVANDRWLIRKPTPNPLWYQESPFVVTPLVRVPHSVWHMALMDAPTRHNTAINEIFNLIFDAGMMATYGIKQIRTDWLADESQVSGGIRAGQTLSVTSSAPVGAKVLERVDTSSMSSESLQTFQLAVAEFNQSALTNDLRLGILPARQVKATEVVEASQSITSVFTGVAKSLETGFLKEVLRKSWLMMCQHMDEFNSAEVAAIVGKDTMLKMAAMTPEQRFVALAQSYSYRVYGVSEILSKTKDFRKLVSLLQTMGGSEVFMQEFIKEFSFGKFLKEIMQSLDINTDKIKQDPIDAAAMAGGEQAPMGGADVQSQIKQASTGSTTETVQSRLQAKFPPQALSAGGRSAQ